MSDLYKESGVNLEEANNLAAKLGILGDNFQSFAGSVDFCGGKIVNCCDGIGSKIIPLYERKLFKTIAVDLAAANLNDLATKNARAIGFSDYISVHTLDSFAISEIIIELHKVLKNYGCSLLGGETSEIPALLKKGAIDICGFAIGVEEKNFSPDAISQGDLVIVLKSNGIHANGFSLIRKFFSENKLSESEFEECLKPSYIYYDIVRELWKNNLIKSAANITGGGIYTNLIRSIPENFGLDLNYQLIPRQEIYKKLYTLCGDEIYEVFNCGVGFCVIASPENAGKIFDICKTFEPFIFGKVVEK